MTSKQKALLVLEALMNKQGMDVRALDLAEVSAFTDFFVIATGSSDRHVRTLAETAVETARQLGEQPLGVEGERLARWILIDLGDVVVHLFQRETRDFYDLERLWGDAEPLEVERLAGGAC